MAVLFLNTCQCFHSTAANVGGPVHSYDEELLTIFVLVWYLFTLQEEVGAGRGG